MSDRCRWALHCALLAGFCTAAEAMMLPGDLQGQTVAQGGAVSDSAPSLRPGDAIRLRIWREPDLSGEFQVDESGVVVLPKLGPKRVTDQHPDALKAWITQSYAAYLKNPSIEVQVLRRIQVLGAVKNPGLYPVDPTLTVADALALAGGVTEDGQSNKIQLRRQGEALSGRLRARQLIGNSPIQSGDQLFVPQRSWLSRNPGIVIGVLGLVSTVIWRVSR